MGHKTLLAGVALSAVTATVVITAFATISQGKLTWPWSAF